jgi:ketosteroid isomerase-like protein
MKFASFALASALVVGPVMSIACAENSPQTKLSAVVPEMSLHDAAVALGRNYDALYSRKDVTGMADLYAADGELVSPGGKIIHGHAELEAYYRARFASGATGHKIEVLETHGLGDAGYSVANFSVSVPAHGSEKQRRESGHIAAVYAHDTTGWHFVLVQPSTIPADGG